MGELREGDDVFDETGTPCRVVFATDVMHGRPCYRVNFSDGTSIVADADHLWLTRTRKPEGAYRVWTTAQIAETQRLDYVGSEGANHSVRLAGPLRCEP